MAKDVFISHSSKDSKTALKICRMLEQRGLVCWIAPRDVTPGKPYAEEIIDAIESTHATVLVLSAHANTSVHVRNEVDRAVTQGKTVLPVRIREVAPSKALALYIGAPHWVEAWKPPLDQKMDQLASAIAALANKEPRAVANARWSLRPRPLWLGLGAALVLIVVSLFIWQRSSPVKAVSGGGTQPSPAVDDKQPIGPVKPQGPLTASDLSSVKDQAAFYSAKLRELPFGAAAYKDDLQALAENLQADPRYSRVTPAAVATVFRLYSAALIMTPAGGNALAPIRTGLPWLLRSTELYEDFQDRAALKTTQDFFIKLLDGTTPSVDASVFIGHQIRVAMIEATDDEVEKKVQEAIKTLTPMLKGNR
jgi:hypothetical protein